MKDWIVTAIVAGAAAVAAYSSTATTVGSLKDDMRDIKTWKDSAIAQMGSMDGKLDALLQAQGVTYQPPGGKHGR